MNSPRFPLDIVLAIGKLKQVQRAGWRRFPQIAQVESVSDHSFRVSLLSLLLGDEKSLNIGKCVSMGLVHDLAESIVGDLTPYDGVSKEEKSEREDKAMIEITGELTKELKDCFYGLWREYEEGVTPEAQVVKDLDKYEMMVQALEYERRYGINLGEFFKAAEAVKHPRIREWTGQLLLEREKKNINGEWKGRCVILAIF